MARQPQQFKVLFCERFGYPLPEYEERAFRRLLYGHAKPFAWLLRLLSPNFFLEDFKFVAALGAAVDSKEARADAANFHDVNKYAKGVLRTSLNLRVSGRKALRLAHEIFGAAMVANHADARHPAADENSGTPGPAPKSDNSIHEPGSTESSRPEP